MYPTIQSFCNNLTPRFSEISEDRKQLLQKISHFIQTKKDSDQPINLVYVCTHNSRRSHFGQVWAAVAANYFGIKNLTDVLINNISYFSKPYVASNLRRKLN